MTRLESAALTVVAVVVGVLLFAGGLVPSSRAQTAPDRSEIVLVLDFSASILEDVTNRDRFAAALDRIADRIDATSSDLVVGDATVTIVQFAAKATDYGGCVGLQLLDSPETVARFADCVRNVAKAYRKGLDPDLSRRIGVDTNYVAAMEQAASHLTKDAVRPALILFTDGKHDVKGVPLSEVEPARQRLFGSRSPFALLPVGMGLDPAERAALERGLVNMRIIRAMPACVSGSKFDWPQVVFESADEAGNAVAVALQDVSCTFTVAPPETPAPETPAPVPTPGPVRNIKLTPGDGRVEVAWMAPAVTPAPIVEYRIRCRTADGDWTEANEGASLKTLAVVDGLTNGVTYECAVAAVDAESAGEWTAALATVVPVGQPPAPDRPVVEALDGGVRVHVPVEAAPQVSSYRYECSSDQGRSWPFQIDVPASGVSTADIGNVPNGPEYQCRAYAINAAGLSDPSAPSDAVRLCGSFLDCNPVLRPVLGGLGFLAVTGVLLTLVALFRRTRGYVVAVVDVVHTANLGHGSRLGIEFVRTRPGGPVTGIAADRRRNPDIRIRWMRGNRFEVVDQVGRYITKSGEPVVTTNSLGVRHELVLRGFSTATASPVSSRGPAR